MSNAEADQAALQHFDPDPLLTAFPEEPHAFWDSLRVSREIPFSRRNGGVYLPTRYSDVLEILEQPNLFSSRQIIVGPSASARTPPFPPFTSDPPFHSIHRGFLAPILSTRNIGKFQRIAERTIDPILERLVDQPVVEVVSEFSLPFVVRSIGVIIGIADSEMDDFYAEASAHIRLASSNRTECHTSAAILDRRLRGLLLRRVAEPRDDIASALASTRHNGAALDKVFSALLLRVLIEAGTETTAGVITFAIRHLADETHRATLNDPLFSWKRAVEEFLRFSAPATLARRSEATSMVGACPIANDSAVLLSFAAANRDPDVFNDPHTVNLGRHKNRHLAFGAGIHRCLGMHLARVLIGIGVKRWIESFPSYHLDSNAQVPWSSGPVRAITRLDLSTRTYRGE